MKEWNKFLLIGTVLSVALFVSVYPTSSHDASKTVMTQSMEVVNVLPHYAHLKDKNGEVSLIKFTQHCQSQPNIKGKQVPITRIVKELQNGKVIHDIDRDSVMNAVCMSS